MPPPPPQPPSTASAPTSAAGQTWRTSCRLWCVCRVWPESLEAAAEAARSDPAAAVAQILRQATPESSTPVSSLRQACCNYCGAAAAATAGCRQQCCRCSSLSGSSCPLPTIHAASSRLSSAPLRLYNQYCYNCAVSWHGSLTSSAMLGQSGWAWRRATGAPRVGIRNSSALLAKLGCLAAHHRFTSPLHDAAH